MKTNRLLAQVRSHALALALPLSVAVSGCAASNTEKKDDKAATAADATHPDGTAPPAAWIARMRSKNGSGSRVMTAPPITSPWPPRYLVVA